MDLMFLRDLPALLTARLPSRCAVCHGWPGGPVCAPCMSRFAQPCQRCHRCALSTLGVADQARLLCSRCRREPFGLDACFAALPYAFPWSGLVARYKFADQTGWTPFLAGLMLAQPGVREALHALGPQDWLLPMPLSAERLGWRGYNQAWELTRSLQGQSSCAARADSALLLRTRHTRPQSELKRSERHVNVKGAFALEPLRAVHVSGRRVMLVDDVMTSGASLLAAATALRQAGAAEVSAIVLARTAPT
jgi:ComF family protein